MGGGPGGGGMGGPGGMGGGPLKVAWTVVPKAVPRVDKGMAPQGGQDAPKQLSEKDIEKRMKNMAKQEEKLAKSMKKVLVTDELYNEWLEYHESQRPHKPEDFHRPNQQ